MNHEHRKDRGKDRGFGNFTSKIDSKTLVAGLIIAMLFFPACATTGPGPDAPDAEAAVSPLIRFYRGPLNHLSSVRQGQCPMHPSCSEYADQAIAKHGPVVGWTMALDRLMRCGRDETKRNRKIRVNGEVLFYDPVEENDGWWNADQHGRPTKP